VLSSLGRRAVALLQVLVGQPGTLVAKDALIEAGWPGQTVEESNLTVQIGALRRVLEEVPGGVHRIDTLPRRGYRFMGPVAKEENGGTAALPIEVAPAPTLPDKPSIAVLPFKNMSGDPEQDYFADGMVEEIITALSRMRWLFVIASNSSFTYKNQAVDEKQVSRELGVRYVLEGSVRKAANRVRIIGQLIDATTGAHIWADRFDGELEDIFDLQDQVTASVVGAIAPRLEQAEIERARRKPTENLGAYDYFLRGMAKVYQWTRETNDEALRLFYRAIELDPDFASAYGQATWCYAWRKANGCVADLTFEIGETERLARRAVVLGKDDAFALCWAGYSLAFVVGEFDDGAAFMDRSLALNPNLARAWHLSGWVRIWVAKPEWQSNTSRVRCASAHAIRPFLICRRPPRTHICIWAVMTKHCCGRSGHFGSSQIGMQQYGFLRRAARCWASRRRRKRQWRGCSRAIRRGGFLISEKCWDHTGRTISRGSPTACERPGCPSNRVASGDLNVGSWPTAKICCPTRPSRHPADAPCASRRVLRPVAKYSTEIDPSVSIRVRRLRSRRLSVART